jgi:hypothetical protein
MPLGDCETGCISCFQTYYAKAALLALIMLGMPFTTRIVQHFHDEQSQWANGTGFHHFAYSV